MAVLQYQSMNEFLVETRHYWIEALRVFIGAMILYRGLYFTVNVTEIYPRIDESFFVSAFVSSHYVITVHIVGGILIMIGLLTRLAIVFQLPIFFAAVFFVAGKDIMIGLDSNFEYALLNLVILTVFLFYGAGKWSVDHKLMRRKEAES